MDRASTQTLGHRWQMRQTYLVEYDKTNKLSDPQAVCQVGLLPSIVHGVSLRHCLPLFGVQITLLEAHLHMLAPAHPSRSLTPVTSSEASVRNHGRLPPEGRDRAT